MKTPDKQLVPSTDKLIQFLVSKNHKRIKAALSSMEVHSDTSSKVDGKIHPEATMLREYFLDLKEKLEQHMSKEERFFFPLLCQISAGKINLKDSGLGNDPLKEFRQEHKQIEALVDRIKIISNNYNMGVDCSPSLKLFCLEFLDFEHDVEAHIGVEENLLLEN